MNIHKNARLTPHGRERLARSRRSKSLIFARVIAEVEFVQVALQMHIAATRRSATAKASKRHT